MSCCPPWWSYSPTGHRCWLKAPSQHPCPEKHTHTRHVLEQREDHLGITNIQDTSSHVTGDSGLSADALGVFFRSPLNKPPPFSWGVRHESETSFMLALIASDHHGFDPLTCLLSRIFSVLVESLLSRDSCKKWQWGWKFLLGKYFSCNELIIDNSC